MPDVFRKSPVTVADLAALDPLLATRVTVIPDGCWPCSLYANRQGYARIKRAGRTWKAHRYVYELLVGNIGVDAEGAPLQLDHDCHNEARARGECAGDDTCRHRRCCNPEHLTPRAASDHQKDNPLAVEQAARTRCPGGHEYTPENTRVGKNGERFCRACNRERNVAIREAAKTCGMTRREYVRKHGWSQRTAERVADRAASPVGQTRRS